MHSFVWDYQENASKSDSSVSTLILSPSSALFLNRYLLANRKQFQGLLNELIHKHKLSLISYLSNLKQKKNLRISYQSYRKGKDSYIRINCRPNHREWSQIGMIANGFRVSRAYIISLLIEWERLARKKKIVRVPTTYPTITIKIKSLLLKQKRNFHFRL